MTSLRYWLTMGLLAATGCAHGGSGRVVYLLHGAGDASVLVAKAEGDCRSGDAAACLDASDILFQGYGVAKDPHTAMALAQHACALGSATGCALAAGSYLDGKDLPKNAPRAFALAQKGCGLGLASSCTRVGEMLARGTGVPADAARALTFLERGCHGGDHIGCTLHQALVEGSKTLPAKAPKPRGVLTDTIVLAIMRDAEQAMKRCYETGLRRTPSLCGTVVTHFVVVSSGHVLMVDATKSSVRDSAVDECVARVVGRLQFPGWHGPGIADITYPWIFRVGHSHASCHDELAPHAGPLFPERSKLPQPKRTSE